jgi:hypothetical protein
MRKAVALLILLPALAWAEVIASDLFTVNASLLNDYFGAGSASIDRVAEWHLASKVRHPPMAALGTVGVALLRFGNSWITAKADLAHGLYGFFILVFLALVAWMARASHAS